MLFFRKCAGAGTAGTVKSPLGKTPYTPNSNRC